MSYVRLRSSAITSVVLLILILAAFDLSACSPAYVMRAAYEEAHLLWAREPIARMLKDETLKPADRDKLEIVAEARFYASRTIGLDVGGSYNSISPVRSSAVVHLITAARRDRLKSYTWWFPIVGRIPYKGFFNQEQAKAEAEGLKADGYDVYVRPSVAFSTLGWFDDPLLSTLLRLDRVSLANTVFHELFHNTLYVPGESDFNESAANFVGSRAAIEFFCRGPRRSVASCDEANAEWRDAILMSRFLSAELDRLEHFYDSRPSSRALKRGRARMFAGIRERFSELELETNRYANFLADKLNNASLLHDRTYYRDLDVFEELYRQQGSVARVVEVLRAAASGAAKPFDGLKEALDHHRRWQLANLAQATS